MVDRYKAVNICAFACALLALAISIVAYAKESSRGTSEEISESVYERILAEVRLEIAPVYEDFGLEMREAESFRELLQPLVGVDRELLQDTNTSQ